MSSPARVLIVDDEPDVRELVSRYLEKSGFAVEAVPDGLHALDVIGQRTPDLVLLDAMMPGLSGLDVLRRLRGRLGPRELPVIVVTALAASSDVVEFLEAGANDYVSKPFSLPVLLARIKTRLLDRTVEPTRPTPSPDVAPLADGAIDSRFELLDVIGEGRFGVVRRARHRALGKQVAIKIFRDVDASDPTRVGAVLREGIASCRLEHPNAVNVLDVGLASTGEAYLVMEYLEGETFASLLFREHWVGPARAAELLLPVAFVLVEAHARGIIHGDLKPENVFLHRRFGQETPKVLDFGVAAILGAIGDPSTADAIVGTPAYMAPETVLRKPPTGAIDVYALGCALFEALTGDVPFLGASGVETAVMQVRSPVPDVDARLPSVDVRLRKLLVAMLQKDPAKRPTAADVVRMLGNLRS